MSLKDKVVLLPGAGGGFGPTLARAFAAAGSRLALAGRKEEPLRALARDAGFEPARTLVQAVDVGETDSVDSLVQAVRGRFGGIDVLVNIVGGFRAGKAVHEMSDEDWEAMFAVNARSTFVLCRAVLPVMLVAGAGKVVNIASKLGLHAERGASAYAASKSAVLRLTEAIAAEVGGRGINVNAVIPATIDTPANREAMPGADRAGWVQPGDLASVILFLASDGARAIHGAAIPVYGRPE